MFAVTRVSISPRFLAPQDAVFSKSFSSKTASLAVNGDYGKRSSTISELIDTSGLSSKGAFFTSKKSSSAVNGDDPRRAFAISYLINTCGLSSKDALSVSLKTRIKSPENPDSILKVLRRYGFTDAHIHKIIIKYPKILTACPVKNLLPKLELLHSIGVPESSIIFLLVDQPSILTRSAKSLTTCIDKATEMGFDKSKAVFILAIQTFASMSETTLERKKEVYRRYGWSEFDIYMAFLKCPSCMKLSEKKIMDTMNYLVNELGLQPVSVARRPIILFLNIDTRMKPRYLVARVLKEKGLFKKQLTAYYFFKVSEDLFLKRYIVKYAEHVPELLDIYRGKLTVSDMEFTELPILR